MDASRILFGSTSRKKSNSTAEIQHRKSDGRIGYCRLWAPCRGGRLAYSVGLSLILTRLLNVTCLSAPCKGGAFPVGESPTWQPLQPEATGAIVEVTKRLPVLRFSPPLGCH
jgi:hypothetical protein